jgi:hypothetical protein
MQPLVFRLPAGFPACRTNSRDSLPTEDCRRPFTAGACRARFSRRLATEDQIMRKLALDLDGLAVQSFETQGSTRSRGTVRGNEWTEPTSCWIDTDVVSCGGSCDYTWCDATCAGCGGTGGNSCRCVTQAITCEQTSPNPVGTCCGAEC